MDYQRIALLLSVFHSSLNVPNTDNIRQRIMSELKDHNTWEPFKLGEPESVDPAVTSVHAVDQSQPVTSEPGEFTLDFMGRRL